MYFYKNILLAGFLVGLCTPFSASLAYHHGHLWRGYYYMMPYYPYPSSTIVIYPNTPSNPTLYPGTLYPGGNTVTVPANQPPLYNNQYTHCVVGTNGNITCW
jgi:hypothetical protein